MRKTSDTVKCQQFHLTLAQRRPKSCFERISLSKASDTTLNEKADHHHPHYQDETANTVVTTVERCQSQVIKTENGPSPSSHDCVCLESRKRKNGKVSQQILVSSALRRPHASQYSQLDSQTMPEQVRPASRNYRPKSASTVYSYAKRPVSACDTSAHLGRQTKASLLRSKSALEVSRSYKPTSSFRDSNKRKKPCVVRQEYMLHKNQLTPKEVFDHMKTVHAYLTGARYNRSRLLDSKSLSTLGVYTTKSGLNTFIVKKTKTASKLTKNVTDAQMTSQNDEIVSNATLKVIESQTSQDKMTGVATNTEPYYLSLDKWHDADWSSVRGKKQLKPSKLDSRRPVSPTRMKPIKTQYINYNNIVQVR